MTWKKHDQIDGITVSTNYAVDMDGIVTITEVKTFAGSSPSASSSAVVKSDWDIIGDAHSEESYCLCVAVSMQDETPVKKRTAVYKGINGSTKRFSLTATGAQEPITTHPAFKEAGDGYAVALAGTGADKKNGAKFKGDEEDSEFDYFPPDADRDLGGVTSYLEPAVELQCVIVKNNADMEQPTWELANAIYNIADRVAPPQGAPSVGTRNWLAMGSTQEIIGGAIKITVNYRMSGARGWNEAIYQQG